MTLSDKRIDCFMRNFNPKDIIYFEEDVKEFIKKLIGDCSLYVLEEDEKFMIRQIKIRAGKELVE